MLGHSPMTTADSHGLRTRVSGQKIWWDCFPLRRAPPLCSSQQTQTQSPGPPFSRGYGSRVILKARMLWTHLCINSAIAATCDPWVRKIPWRRAWQPTPVFLPEESHGQRSLVGYSPWGRRVGHDWSDLARMQLPEGFIATCQEHGLPSISWL